MLSAPNSPDACPTDIDEIAEAYKQQDALTSQRQYLVALKHQGREFVIGRYATELEQMVACDAARNAMALVQADAIITSETVGQ